MGFMGGLAKAFGGGKSNPQPNPQAGGLMGRIAPVQNLQGLGQPPMNPAMQGAPPPMPMRQPTAGMLSNPGYKGGGIASNLMGLGARPSVMPQLPPQPHPADMPQGLATPLPPPPAPVNPAPQPSAMNPLNMLNPLRPPTSGKQLGQQLTQPFKQPVKTAKKIFMPWK